MLSKNSTMGYNVDVGPKLREIQADNVLVRNMEEVDDKLRDLIKDGPENLQILADFDGTLTLFELTSCDKKRSLGSFEIFNRTKTLSSNYQDKYAALNTWIKKQLFISNVLPEDRKEEAVNEWFSEVEMLVTKEKVRKEDIQEAVDGSNTSLRQGCDSMFSFLSDRGIPLTVVSAGVGEVITYMLQDVKSTVVANFWRYDDSGRIQGFTRPLITATNKHSIPLPVDKSRHNIVLLGDIPEDCRIGESIEDTKTVLKIGFFTGGDDSRLQKYLSCYDIVLVDEPTMDTVTAILKMIVGVK